jgi:hypothetical protein
MGIETHTGGSGKKNFQTKPFVYRWHIQMHINDIDETKHVEMKVLVVVIKQYV